MPIASATHSAIAVPAPIPVGPQSSAAANHASSSAFTPLSTICSRRRLRVRPVPSSQPLTP